MALYNQIEDFAFEEPVPEFVDTWDEIPKEMDIFYRQVSAFLPEGKTLEDLTPEELNKIKAQYRFDPMRPGIAQTITGFGYMI
ncbi:MAG: hypothetical protein WC119_02155 [Synergistaceae bacterium]